MIAETSSEAGMEIIERKVQPLQTYYFIKMSKLRFFENEYIVFCKVDVLQEFFVESILEFHVF